MTVVDYDHPELMAGCGAAVRTVVKTGISKQTFFVKCWFRAVWTLTRLNHADRWDTRSPPKLPGTHLWTGEVLRSILKGHALKCGQEIKMCDGENLLFYFWMSIFSEFKVKMLKIFYSCNIFNIINICIGI